MDKWWFFVWKSRLNPMSDFSMKNLLKTCIHTLWKLVQLLLFMLIVPPLINYASLKREAPLLGEHGRISYIQRMICLSDFNWFFLQVYRMMLDTDRNCFYDVEAKVYRQVDSMRDELWIEFSVCLVILDTPVGMNSDLWLPLQESLKQKTTVNRFELMFFLWLKFDLGLCLWSIGIRNEWCTNYFSK